MAAELRRLVSSTLADRDKAIGIAFLVAFVITVVGANWALLTYGIVPIGFGLDAPASVYFVGLTFTFRDGLRERLGFKGALLAIAIGGVLSYILEIRQDGDLFARIALASAAAFAISESPTRSSTSGSASTQGCSGSSAATPSGWSSTRRCS